MKFTEKEIKKCQSHLEKWLETREIQATIKNPILIEDDLVAITYVEKSSDFERITTIFFSKYLEEKVFGNDEIIIEATGEREKIKPNGKSRISQSSGSFVGKVNL